MNLHIEFKYLLLSKNYFLFLWSLTCHFLPQPICHFLYRPIQTSILWILTHLYWWFNDFSGHSGEKHIRWIWAEDPVWVSSWGQCCLPKGLSCCVSPTATHSIHLTQNEEIRLSLLDAVFCFSHNLLDSKINTLLSLCQDPNLLNPVHGIVQSVVYHEESPPQYQTPPTCKVYCYHSLNLVLRVIWS